MGCLKLTYDFEPILFLEEHPEKNQSAELQVWVNPDATFEGVGIKTLTQEDPEDYKEINYHFSTDFSRHFGFLQNVPNPTADGIISRVWDKQGAVLSRDDKRYQMRPLYFTLQGPGITGTLTTNLIDPKYWTLDPIWGNPGTIRSGPSQTGIPTPMTIPFNGSFYLTIYFQKAPIVF
ncbi:MAG: hypothetical protein ACK5SJ_06820, partial [Bacteroidota bacterium]|jgi:hypothetical protein